MSGDFLSHAPERLGEGAYRCPEAGSTSAFGYAMGEVLEPGDVVILSGDLGAGKTCLTGGVALSLGDTCPVTSPTFSILSVHDGGRMPLYHFDLYRLEDASQLEDVGIFELLDADGACLVEWGEQFSEELGEDRLEVRLLRDGVGRADGEPPRLVSFRGTGARSCELARALDDRLIGISSERFD